MRFLAENASLWYRGKCVFAVLTRKCVSTVLWKKVFLDFCGKCIFVALTKKYIFVVLTKICFFFHFRGKMQFAGICICGCVGKCSFRFW